MLKLITGTAGTGKSEYIKQKILENAKKEQKSILIVPEQFSKTAEAEIFSALEKNSFGFVSVFSFTSLLRDVYSEAGKVTPAVLTDAGKAVIAQKSMQSVYRQLQSFANQRHNVTFSYELCRLFEDFKRNGIDGTQLFAIAQAAPQINSKLKDISLIYSQYSANMTDSGNDMEQLYLQLGQSLPVSYTEKTQIFIDGFESFTHGQYAIIGRMLLMAEDVYISLTADRVFDNTNGTHPLSYTANTAAKLIALAKKLGVQAAAAEKMERQYRFANATLRNIDNFLLSKPLEQDDEKDNAFVTSFPTQFEEVSFAAAKINNLVKSGYSYDDIVIVCPQIEKYEHQLQESFSLAQIPYFIDQNRIIVASAPVVLFKNVLEVMDKGVNGSTVLPLLKTQLTCFDAESIDLLENYIYIWQGQQLDWSKRFTLPYGKISDGEVLDEDDETLAKINSLVKGINRIFAPFLQQKDTTGEQILTAMYDIVTQLKSEEILVQMIEQSSDKEKSDLFVRQWETVIDCINELYRICGNMTMKPAELSELFMLMVQGTEIGFAPQTQDCVMISTPQRMKTDSVKVVFILGAGQDIFPSLVSDSGILSSADLEYLKNNDCTLSRDFAQRFAFENLYFYKTMTTAREKLFVSCAEKNIDSQEILSAEIEGIKDALGLDKCTLAVEDYCLTTDFFVQYISETKGKEGQAILSQLGIDIPDLSSRCFEIKNLENLKQLVGNHMIISPTAAESYFKCSFGYLIRNLFRIYPLEKAQLTQREAGDYLHTVAQQVLEKYKGDYYKTPWEEIEAETKQIVSSYLQHNYPQQVRDTARFASLSDNMQQNALQLLQYMHSEQKASQFRPIAFEKNISFDSDIKPLTITLDDGSRVSVVGVCDRIDTMEKDGRNYIRIVDYKTGTKKFSLEDVYNGLSSQLLLYMGSVTQSDGFVPNPVPAAVMYQPSDAAFKFDEDGSLYTPVGMAVDSRTVSEGFDNECLGRFGVIQGDEKLKKVTGSEIVDEKLFHAIMEHSKDKIKEMAQAVYAGQFDNLPMDLGGERTSCEWCGYRPICQEFDRIKPRQKAEFRVKGDEQNG